MPTNIDPKSVVLFAGASVVIALVLCVAMRRHERGDPAIGWLIASNLALLTAALGLLGRPYLGFEASSVLVIGGAYTGVCCAFVAVLAAESQKPPLVTLIVIGLVALGIQATIAVTSGSANLLMLSSSVINSTLTCWMTCTIWRLLRPYGRRIATLLALPFAAFCFGYTTRMVAILGWPDSVAPMAATVLIVTMMAWAALILELGMIALRETQARRALAKALEKAEAASEAKSKFLRSISHELRTPLNAVIGFAELMRAETSGPMPIDYRPFVSHIHEAGKHLLSLITDLLDMSTIEAGKMQLDEEPVLLSEVIEAVEHMVADKAKRGALTLNFKLLPNAPERVMADRRRLIQILTNLTDNAVKYTGKGGDVRVQAGQGEDGGLLLLIGDTGPGMTPAQLADAMELFGRVHGVESKIEGTGIGLPLARDMVTAHGGKMQIDSTPGEGTTITVSLPSWRSEVANEVEGASPPAERLTASGL
ncbi:MAG: HAMP domain-containing sensor histidine kinase [Pseudomonadota bacterium]